MEFSCSANRCLHITIIWGHTTIDWDILVCAVRLSLSALVPHTLVSEVEISGWVMWCGITLSFAEARHKKHLIYWDNLSSTQETVMCPFVVCCVLLVACSWFFTDRHFIQKEEGQQRTPGTTYSLGSSQWLVSIWVSLAVSFGNHQFWFRFDDTFSTILLMSWHYWTGQLVSRQWILELPQRSSSKQVHIPLSCLPSSLPYLHWWAN